MMALQVEFPKEGRKADVSGINAVRVVSEDLAFFTNLTYLDCGRNSLTMEALAVLQRLEELRLPCNGLRDIGNLHGSFEHLRTLDLSYNGITTGAVAGLAVLPALRTLDLTANDLRFLPPPEDMRRFKALERFRCERNGMSDGSVFLSLGACPRLGELHLGENLFSHFPEEAVGEGQFPELGTFSLAMNVIQTEVAVEPVVRLMKLELLMLYGNPLLGPKVLYRIVRACAPLTHKPAQACSRYHHPFLLPPFGNPPAL